MQENQQDLKIQEFNTYVRKAVARLISEATRLGVTADQLAAVAALFGTVTTAGTWLYEWELYAGGPVTCTTNVRLAIGTLRGKLEKEFSSIYDDIPASLWNDDDRATFMRAKGLPVTRTAPGKITDQCIVAWEQQGGGTLKGLCKTAHTESRPGLAPNADEVEIAYTLVDQTPGQIETGGGSIKLDELKTPDDAAKTESFPTAIFLLKLGPANSGRRILYWIHWNNQHHKENEGPWNGPFSQNIL